MKFNNYKKANTEIELLKSKIDFQNKLVVDVGCGTGRLTRQIAKDCSFIFGVDTRELICKAVETDYPDNIQFLIGGGENLNIIPHISDIVIYFASFHHIPEDKIPLAIDECYNTLKTGGVACFCEPVPQADSYYELTRLVEDEKEVQARAYEVIKNTLAPRFKQISESFHFFERSFQDYLNLIEIYVTDLELKNSIVDRAWKIVSGKNQHVDAIKFKSFVRMNLLVRE